MLDDNQIMAALNTVYTKLIECGHDPAMDYMIEFQIVIQEQPELHKAIYRVTEAMDNIADRYIGSQ